MIENLTEFYKRINKNEPETPNKGEAFVDVNESQCRTDKTSFSYRDFYKIALVLDTGRLFYANKWILVDSPAILFSNPLVPYAWEAISQGKERGMYCIFNDAFLKAGGHNNSLAETPLLDITRERIYFIDDATTETLLTMFRKMEQELRSDYPLKADIVRCYVHLLVHETMKTQTSDTYTPRKNAGQRTVELFLTLLERQFPIDLPGQTLALKTANHFAEHLSVHVNHLNRVVKATTGRTTSTIINNRIVQEALQLLQHSNHSITEIAYGLGFEELASFSNFIKKHTQSSPTSHRLAAQKI